MLSADQSFLIWGHDNGPLINTNLIANYPTDNGETIETIFSRTWKSQETGTVNTVTLEFDMSTVIGTGGGTGTNDLANLRLLIDEDGDYSDGGATSIAPSSYNNTTNIAYFEIDFVPPTGPGTNQNRGFFFTLGSTDFLTTPLPVEFSDFSFNCLDNKTEITWSTLSELNADYFEIQQSRDGVNFNIAGTTEANGTTNLTSYYSLQIDKSSDVQYIRIIQADLNGNKNELGVFTVSCIENEIKMYPNPASNHIIIEAKGYGASQIGIYDLTGRLVKPVQILNLQKTQ